MLDLTGQKFGLLTAVSTKETDGNSRTKLWLLKCDCGAEVYRSASALRSASKNNLKSSCGCHRTAKIDLNEKYGWLTPIRRLDKKKLNKGWMWEFKCDCGNITEKYGSEVSRKHGAQHCGCMTRKRGPDTSTKIGQLSGKRWSAIVYGATRRALSINVSMSYASELFDKQMGKCAISGLPICLPEKRDGGTASLDRRDSALPYTEDNIQWVHKDVNRAKGSMSDNDFVALCRLVVNNADTH